MTNLASRIALIALTLPIAGIAIAQAPPMAGAPLPPPAAVPPPPSEAPAGDAMTLAQFQAQQESRFLAADTDGDGRVSLAEWSAAMATRRHGGGGEGGGHGGGHGSYDPSRMFDMMDANHDGYLDKGEIDAAAAERFRRMDSNGDGVVTPDERAASRGGGGRQHWGQGGSGQ